MVAVLCALLLTQTTPAFTRDTYGVPHIVASSWEGAFYSSGYAVAEDRLWQMDLSRRLSRGRMAEFLGADYVDSDREVLQTAYTDSELKQQFDALSASTRAAISAYAQGINAYMADAKRDNKLPPNYAKMSATPEPWTELDSIAISIRLWRMFGRGGAGELRDLAALEYLKTQKCKDKYLDVIDDFAWQNDPASPTTVFDVDDPLAKTHPVFPEVTRASTEKQLKALPKLNIFELLPAIRLSSNETSTRVAQSLNVPYKAGSYAIVVSKNRSATGTPLLLSGPQMGFNNPSIIHEMSISGPGVHVVGMDVPGIPGVLIGHTPRIAWGLTSGVADIEDIFYFKTDGADGYTYGNEKLKLDTVKFALKVKGGETVEVTQRRTKFGPVVLSTKSGGGFVFARRASYWMCEMKSYDGLFKIYEARTIKDIRSGLSDCPMTFNAFYATVGGEIGYSYLGAVPIRASGLDPRFPTFATPENDWKGMIPFSQMPHVENPKGGLITNWNNKAVKWWPNGDTPVWGAVNRISLLNKALERPLLSTTDIEMAAWTIARRNESSDAMLSLIRGYLDKATLNPVESDALRYLKGFDGWFIEGSQGAALYSMTYLALQEDLFYPSTGTFISPDLFRTIAQPSVVLLALQSRSHYNYLGTRTAKEVVVTAFKKAVERLTTKAGADPGLWRYACNKIQAFGDPPVPYSNRGSYIQIIELRDIPRGRNVLAPGVAESGAHATDQIELSRAWMYKSMTLPGVELGK